MDDDYIFERDIDELRARPTLPNSSYHNSWLRFAAQVGEKRDALAEEAEAAMQAACATPGFDYAATRTAIGAVIAQLDKLSDRLLEPTTGGVSRYLESVWPERTREVWEELEAREHEASRTANERTRIRLEAIAAEAFYAPAMAEEGQPVYCTQCGAALSPTPYQTVPQYLTCGSCQTVSTYQPPERTKLLELDAVPALVDERCAEAYAQMSITYRAYEEASHERYLNDDPFVDKRLAASIERTRESYERSVHTYAAMYADARAELWPKFVEQRDEMYEAIVGALTIPPLCGKTTMPVASDAPEDSGCPEERNEHDSDEDAEEERNPYMWYGQAADPFDGLQVGGVTFLAFIYISASVGRGANLDELLATVGLEEPGWVEGRDYWNLELIKAVTSRPEVGALYGKTIQDPAFVEELVLAQARQSRAASPTAAHLAIPAELALSMTQVAEIDVLMHKHERWGLDMATAINERIGVSYGEALGAFNRFHQSSLALSGAALKAWNKDYKRAKKAAKKRLKVHYQAGEALVLDLGTDIVFEHDFEAERPLQYQFRQGPEPLVGGRPR